ncbi:hypothetical protein PoB_007575000 [Plakobranchus ocellatus]|uniref:Uncharacterized protein n=1 Tax=Plakobranchus ocellatus TaxID=259542 RepID=A0AAV4DYV7_9GAST|nr:hypothetical protein PoB_007575000 [Plakobranchus ocellatus]
MDPEGSASQPLNSKSHTIADNRISSSRSSSSNSSNRGSCRAVADCSPTALLSFRPPCDLAVFDTKNIAAMLWPVAVSEEEFAKVSHGSKLS